MIKFNLKSNKHPKLIAFSCAMALATQTANATEMRLLIPAGLFSEDSSLNIVINNEYDLAIKDAISNCVRTHRNRGQQSAVDQCVKQVDGQIEYSNPESFEIKVDEIAEDGWVVLDLNRVNKEQPVEVMVFGVANDGCNQVTGYALTPFSPEQNAVIPGLWSVTDEVCANVAEPVVSNPASVEQAESGLETESDEAGSSRRPWEPAPRAAPARPW